MKLLKSILFSAVIVFIFFSTIELACRLYYIIRYHKIPYNNSIFEYDKDKVYRLRKNYAGTFSNKLVTTNSLGYRNNYISLEKPNNTIRILVVGDSVTFGAGVLAEETYPKQLEKILANDTKRLTFNVINTAVPGNSPFQEYYDLERGLKLSPDIVIMQFVLNDVVEPYWVYRRYGGYGTDYHGVTDLPLKSLAQLYDILKNHSAFYQLLNRLALRVHFKTSDMDTVVKKSIKQELYIDENLIYKRNDKNIQQAWHECLYWMQKEVDLCQKNRIKCILLISPVNFQMTLSDEFAYPQNILKEFSIKNKIEYIDLLSELRKDIGQRLMAKYSLGREAEWSRLFVYKNEIINIWGEYFLDYEHYSPKGHIFVAHLVYPVIKKSIEKNSIKDDASTSHP